MIESAPSEPGFVSIPEVALGALAEDLAFFRVDLVFFLDAEVAEAPDPDWDLVRCEFCLAIVEPVYQNRRRNPSSGAQVHAEKRLTAHLEGAAHPIHPAPPWSWGIAHPIREKWLPGPPERPR